MIRLVGGSLVGGSLSDYPHLVGGSLSDSPSEEREVRVWDLETLRPMHKIRRPKGQAVRSLVGDEGGVWGAVGEQVVVWGGAVVMGGGAAERRLLLGRRAESRACPCTAFDPSHAIRVVRL